MVAFKGEQDTAQHAKAKLEAYQTGWARIEDAMRVSARREQCRPHRPGMPPGPCPPDNRGRRRACRCSSRRR